VLPPARSIGRVVFDFVRPPARRVSFAAHLLDATDHTLVVAHELVPSRPLEYAGVRVLEAGYWAVWFLFKDRPFDVGRIYRPDGTWTGYYVDVLEPVRWRGADPRTLAPLVDLFLDLWIAPDGGYVVLDEDEFAAAVRLGHLTPAQAGHARGVLRSLVDATARGEFPPAVVRTFTL
jgi:predicted RNA-binding protein associated with RNAse of E/G family